MSGGTWSNVQQLPLVVGVDSGFRLLKTDNARNLLLFGRAINSLGTPAQVVVGNQTLAVPANGSVLFIAQILPSSGQLRYVAPVLNSAQVQNARLRLFDAAFDATGNLYFTGGFSGNATFGNSVLSGTPYSTTSNTGSDVFLTKLPNALAPLAARSAALAPALACFPNPARSTATLRLPAPAETAATAVLLDALGRAVRRYAVPARATETTLDVTGLAPGLYLVRYGAAVGRLVVE